MTEDDLYGLIGGVIGFVVLAAAVLALVTLREWLVGAPEPMECFRAIDGYSHCFPVPRR